MACTVRPHHAGLVRTSNFERPSSWPFAVSSTRSTLTHLCACDDQWQRSIAPFVGRLVFCCRLVTRRFLGSFFVVDVITCSSKSTGIAMTEPAFVFGAGEIALLFFVLMTCGVIGYIEHKHCHNFIRPSLQLCYMRMVLLPAVFSVCSYISYLWPHYGVFMEAVRGLPEAYALYCFYCAMVIFAGGQERLARYAFCPCTLFLSCSR